MAFAQKALVIRLRPSIRIHSRHVVISAFKITGSLVGTCTGIKCT